MQEVFEDEPLSVDEGRMQVEYQNKTPEEVKMAINGGMGGGGDPNESDQAKEILGNIWGWTVNAGESAMGYASTAKDAIGQKMEESGATDKISTAASTVSEKSKEYGSVVVEKSSEYGSKLWQGTKAGASSVAENEKVQEYAGAAKEGTIKFG